VILTDAGPLIALIDRRDAEHSRCVTAAKALAGPMLSTWPAFTEAMYLLGALSGWHGQEPLWRMLRGGQLVLADMTPTMLARMPALMEQYNDLPMDLADASLVALAEVRRLREVFTLNADFRVYRLPSGRAFDQLP
jgi:predicted nucleic acid-binding protein